LSEGKKERDVHRDAIPATPSQLQQKPDCQEKEHRL